MTEEEKKRLYGPEKGHYNADAEVYEDLNAAAAEKAKADADLAAAQADLNAAREDHPMLDANKQPQVVAAPAVQPTTAAAPAPTPTVADAPAETTVDRSDAPVYNAAQTPAEGDLAAAQAAYDKAEQETLKAVQDENAARNKSFADMVNDYYAEKKRQEDEMKQREQANMMSSMATGTTELAANIINMLSVGQLHANNQQYKSYSQDWMRKADQDIRDHRHRRDNLGNTLQRLKQQQAQVMAAGRLDDLKARQKKAADDLAAAQEAYNRQQKENEKKAAQDAAMLAKGFRPDASDPSGYRFDPNLSREMAEAKKVPTSRSSSATRRTTTGTSSNAQPQPNYGMRNDGTPKGNGYFGPVETADGNVATEYTVGVEMDGKEMEIPTLVPTLTEEQVDTLVNDVIPNNKPIPDDIMQKAVDHAKQRMKEGKSVFAEAGEEGKAAPKKSAPILPGILNGRREGQQQQAPRDTTRVDIRRIERPVKRHINEYK